ncbi:MAG: protein-L-isoaspartate(D-aspartate) O-methyltransferase [Acidobacteriota bacterium]
MATTSRWYETPHDLSRDAMVQLLERRGIKDPCVLAAMASVPRELFVASDEVDHAYADRPLPIGGGQTISQPYVVALILEALELEPDDRVLEIGTGSGYTAAVLSQLAAHVYSVERVPQLAHDARERLAALGYEWIDVRCGDGSLGWSEHAPFEAIAVHAAGPDIPAALLDQLALGGRLVMPVGRGDVQRLVRATKQGLSKVSIEDLGGVTFVPLVGAQGFPDS